MVLQLLYFIINFYFVGSALRVLTPGDAFLHLRYHRHAGVWQHRVLA